MPDQPFVQKGDVGLDKSQTNIDASRHVSSTRTHIDNSSTVTNTSNVVNNTTNTTNIQSTSATDARQNISNKHKVTNIAGSTLIGALALVFAAYVVWITQRAPAAPPSTQQDVQRQPQPTATPSQDSRPDAAASRQPRGEAAWTDATPATRGGAVSPPTTAESTPSPATPAPSQPIATRAEPPAARAPAAPRLVTSVPAGAVLVRLLGSGSDSDPASSMLATELNGVDPFTPAFVSSGAFDDALGGSTDRLSAVGVGSAAVLVLGRVTDVVSSQAALEQDLKKADVTITGRVFRPQDGFASRPLRVTAVGAGFSPDAAREDGRQKAVRMLADQVKAFAGR